MMDFRDFIKTRDVVLLDGAMGTQLAARGLPMGGENNITNPDAVWEIHASYAQSGCHALITNTLTMNRIYIQTHNLNIDVMKVNLSGVLLAKNAAGKKLFVLGDISSTGQMLEPYGNYSETQFFDNFKEQAEILAAGGVNGFIIETIFDKREALYALKACKTLSLPVMVSLAFETEINGGRTIMGDSATDCAKALSDAGADVIGINCSSLGPFEAAKIISTFKSITDLPILAKPNAGKPRLIEDKTFFDLSPEEFSIGISGCIKAGAKLVGGCCGTSPQHIRAVSNLLNGKQ